MRSCCDEIGRLNLLNRRTAQIFILYVNNMNIHLKPLDEIIKKDFFLPIFMESIVSDERNVY